MPIVYAWMLGSDQIADEVRDALRRKRIAATDIKVTSDPSVKIQNWDITWQAVGKPGSAHLEILDSTTLSELRDTLSYILSPT